MARQIIRTVSELQAAFTKHCSGYGDHPAKDVRDVRYELLTPTEIQTLNDFYQQNLGEYVLIPSLEIFIALLGLEPAGNQVPFITIGDVSYVATRNKYNRTRTMSRIGPAKKEGTYTHTMVAGRWVFNPSDPLVVDCNGQAASLQHRGTAAIEAIQLGAILPPMALNLGMPKQFKDLADKAKARSKIDDSVTDPNVVPDELLHLIELQTNGMALPIADRAKTRTLAVKLRSTLCGMLGQRLNGKDITTTGVKQTFGQEQSIASRFGQIEVAGISYGNESSPEYQEGGIFDAIDVLVTKVLIGTRERTGSALFSNAIIATGLVLASNREALVDMKARELVSSRVSDDTSTQFSEELLRARNEVIEGDLEIDFVLVDKFLELFRATAIVIEKSGAVANASGPFGELFAQLQKHNTTAKGKYAAKRLNYAPTSISAMSSMVSLIKAVIADEVETTESITTRYKDSSDTKDNKEYRSFGGVDIGYQEKSKKSDNE